MKMFFCALASVLVLSSAAFAADSATSTASAGRDECWSARKCTGKILNNKDAHNCKNSGGKSWRSGVTGQCTDL